MKKIILFIAILTTLIWGCQSNDINFSYSGKDAANSGSESGTGGSLARFAIAGNYLFTVDGNYLKTFDISEDEAIKLKSSWQLDWGGGIETLFPYDDKLFLGTTTGMHIIDISEPESPSYISKYEHIVSCDPVVIQGNYAYVTLRSGESWCWRDVNELQVVDLSDINKPRKIKAINMSNPWGLGVDGDLLFVCDNGLKVFEIKSPDNLVQINHFQNIGVTYDVIPYNGLLILSGDEGLRQFAYENNSITELSAILVHK